MFGFGFGEILLLMAIGLIVLGPKQMPQVARVIGRTLAELKKALHDVTASVTVDFKDLDPTKSKPHTEAKPSKAPPPAAEKLPENNASAGPEYIPHKPFVYQELPPHAPSTEDVESAPTESNVTPKKEES